MSFESPGEHGRSPNSSHGSGASTLSSLSADRPLRHTVGPQSGISPDRQKRASVNSATGQSRAHRDPQHRKSFSGEDLTFLSSLSAISLRGSTGSNPQLEKTFFSNADEMLWTKRHDDIRRREEKERLWQIHVENMRKYREPEVARRLESARNHRVFNKKVRETLQKLRPKPEGASTKPSHSEMSQNVARSEPQMSVTFVRRYFYASNGVPVLPEGLEFASATRPGMSTLSAAHGSRSATVVNATAFAKRGVDETTRREDAWFTTAKHRMQQERPPS